MIHIAKNVAAVSQERPRQRSSTMKSLMMNLSCSSNSLAGTVSILFCALCNTAVELRFTASGYVISRQFHMDREVPCAGAVTSNAVCTRPLPASSTGVGNRCSEQMACLPFSFPCRISISHRLRNSASRCSSRACSDHVMFVVHSSQCVQVHTGKPSAKSAVQAISPPSTDAPVLHLM